MGEVTYQADHLAAALARLAEEYKGQPTMAALIGTWIPEIQAIEDMLRDLIGDRGIDSGEGTQLDVIGRIVGQPRGTSSDDAEYRLRLKARVRVNKSSGLGDDILRVFRALLGAGVGSVLVTGDFPAGFTAAIGDHPLDADDAAVFADMLEDARGAAIRATFLWDPVDEDEVFSMEDGPGPGFGDATDASVGGEFSGALEA